MKYDDLIHKFQNVKCLVVGDVMIDHYIYGEVKRISPEAPVPVLNVTHSSVNLGGAANVAVNLSKFHIQTTLCGVVGDDVPGREVLSLLKEKNIEYSGIIVQDRKTTNKTRLVGKGQQIARFDEEDEDELNEPFVQELIKKMNLTEKGWDMVIISDYQKGVCTRELCYEIIKSCNECYIPVIVDPKGRMWDKYKDAFLVTPNWKEFTDIYGFVDPEKDVFIKESGRKLLERFHIKNLLITRSERGMTLVTPDSFFSFQTQAREVADVSGAGDTVVASLASFLSIYNDLEQAVIFANKAAGLAVERQGTAAISLEDMVEENSFQPLLSVESKYYSIEELLKKIESLKKAGKKIVFTNGCFDLLHVGHIEYLKEAKRIGDYLIVALNSDVSVKKQNKGKNRPIIKEEDRIRQLTALEAVDAVILFDDATPFELIKQIKPDYLAKGGDYKIQDIVGREYAKNTIVVPFKEGYSTTGLIAHIQNMEE